MEGRSTRAGRYVAQPTGYRAFITAPLPPDPPLAIDESLAALLSRADQAIGRLDGASITLPNPDLFVAMYVLQEAVLSSQIEGSQSSLTDILTFRLEPGGGEVPADTSEVVNYVRAMNHGLARLATLPLSLRLIREIHGILLEGARGADKTPGEFRTSQNWIGTGFVPLHRATYVPPPPHHLMEALDNFERFLHEGARFPILLQTGLAHGQFETIHPFLDGNGRVGRLLITLMLCHHGVLRRPVLYLSAFLKQHRAEYFDRLTAIRTDGDWEGWIRFFLRGVAETAEDAASTASAIFRLQTDHQHLVRDSGFGPQGLRLLDLLFRQPIVNVRYLEHELGLSFSTANRLLARFERAGIIQEATGSRRNRRFRYEPYLALFEDSGSLEQGDKAGERPAADSR